MRPRVRPTVGQVSLTCRPGTHRSDLFQGSPDVRVYRIPRLVYFSLDHPGSDLFRGMSDLLASKNHRCNLGPALRLCNFSRTFSTGHLEVRSISMQLRSTCFSDPPVKYGVRYTLGQVSFTFRSGSKGPICFKPCPTYFVREYTGAIRGSLCAWARSRVLFDRALGGPI